MSLITHGEWLFGRAGVTEAVGVQRPLERGLGALLVDEFVGLGVFTGRPVV